MSEEFRLPSLIVFFGPDGVGKTTQARLLLRYLSSKKIKASQVWIRGRHSIAFFLSNLFVRLGYYRVVRVPSGMAYRIFDPALLPKLKVLWGVIEFLSVLPLIVRRVFIPRILGKTIVADRYVVDTVAYLGYWLGPSFLNGSISRVLLSLIPKGSLLIHFDAEVSALVGRLSDDTSTEDFLVFQRRVYRKLALDLGAVTIDTTRKGIKETFESVLNILASSDRYIV